MQGVSDRVLENSESTSVEELWSIFSDEISTGIKQFIPSKTIGTRRSLSWITQPIKRLMRKRDKLYFRLKNNGLHKTRQMFLNVKNLIKRNTKIAYNKYIESILGIEDPDVQENRSNFNPKKLYSLLKNSKQDAQGISTLFDNVLGKSTYVNQEKSNVLNRQFQSVFTPMSPLTLSQSCLSFF